MSRVRVSKDGETVRTLPGRSWTLPVAWRQAAVFGAVWGAVEITVGTFLHVTRIPLAGVVLSAAGVALLTAGSMLMPKPFFALRTALVCAALRALSPEGLMFGPMAAILWQGLLVSIAMLLLRQPLVAGMTAGFLASISTQFQAFFVRLISFGADLWELYVRLLEKAEGFFNLEPGQGWIAVIGYLLIVGSVGLAGGAFGWRVGRIAQKYREAPHA